MFLCLDFYDKINIFRQVFICTCAHLFIDNIKGRFIHSCPVFMLDMIKILITISLFSMCYYQASQNQMMKEVQLSTTYMPIQRTHNRQEQMLMFTSLYMGIMELLVRHYLYSIFKKLFLPYCGQVVTGGRNRSTRRKPPPNPKSLATFSHVMDGI